ncbi:MAG: diaminopimelate decarboxylase [Rickettsiaceae bacterium H1]|nr:diaminopimelate decarboxylase [Rickettsiaceae bacterium H1]
MNYLSDQIRYIQNSLWVENVDLTKIKFDTPYYCYTYQGIIDNYRKISRLMPNVLICYAVKANPNISIIKTLVNQGAGADTVSEGEMRRALIGGAKKIIFSGVGKTTQEIEFSLKNNIYQINVESIPELKLVKQIANNLNVNAPIGIRINLDIEGETHDKISTCRKKDKFGIPAEDLAQILDNRIIALSIHIGSQISNFSVFKKALYKLKDILECVKSTNIKRLDLGGGFSTPYHDNEKEFDYSQYYRLANDLFDQYQLIIEPGRTLVANTGILVTKVLFVKQSQHNTHVIIDAGMNDFMRPALYKANHEIIPINNHSEKTEIVDIVGPICESSDTFATQKKLPRLKEGELISICTSGAYGMSMSNNYNSRLLIPEIIIKNDDYFIIREKETYDELIAKELKTNLYNFTN